MAPLAIAMKVSTLTVSLLVGSIESVAAFSVVEIGPNLLAAITSIIGAVVLIVQLQVAKHVRETKEVVKDNHKELTDAVADGTTRMDRIEEENGHHA